MKAILSLTLLAIVGVLAFQNCNKLPSSADSLLEGNQKAQAVRFDMQMADISKISFYFEEEQKVTKSGKSFSMLVNKQLSLSMQSGVLTETFADSESTRSFCIPDEMKNEMVSILGESQICKWGQRTSGDTVCGMALKMPYAEVVMGEEIMSLGSATDTCGNNEIDLCDERGSLLKTWSSKLNSSYSSYPCE